MLSPREDMSEQRARKLMQETLVWDNHGCMPLRPLDERFLPQLQRYRSAGVNVATLNIAWDGVPADTGPRMLASFRRWLGARSDDYLLVRTAQDLDAAQTGRRLGVLFDIEGGCALMGQLSMVQLYYDLGVRWMAIAYNRRNALGGGCLDPDDAGLTAFGRQVVDEMARVGMVTCCSHTGYRTTMEVMERAVHPVIFSHSNALSVWAHKRNIRDEAIRACARTGGVVGINGYGAFVGSDGATTDDFLRHVAHVIELVGPAHVGLGTDYVFDTNEIAELMQAKSSFLPQSEGYSADTPMVEPERLPRIVQGLLRLGLTDDDVKAFLGGNLRRVAGQVWKPIS